MKSVYSAVRTGSINTAVCGSYLKVNTNLSRFVLAMNINFRTIMLERLFTCCIKHMTDIHGIQCIRGEFRPRQTRQLPRAVDLKGRLLSCQSY